MAAVSTNQASFQKFAVGDATPVTTQTAVAAPTDLAESIVAIDAIIARLVTFGLIEVEA